MNWGSTAAERQAALPGDELLSHSTGYSTQAITINAPPDVIWQWLVQIGQDRAGFYSYTWLENLIGSDIHNASTIHPEWQHLTVGDGWRMVPAEYLGEVGKDAVSKVLVSQPDHLLMLEMWGEYVIAPNPAPTDAATSRLIVRSAPGQASLVSTMILDTLVFTMGKRMLLGLKARAEGYADAPTALMIMTWLGWAATGITVAGLLISRRRQYWLVLPILAALPALLMSHHIQAGLAVFIATGIVVLGFLFFGRDWWGSLLILASIVMLTLLLAPEAFMAIGLAFLLLLLITGGAVAAGIPDPLEDAGTDSHGSGDLHLRARLIVRWNQTAL